MLNLDRALAKRPEWHELHSLYGKLLTILGEDADLALQRFDDALKYGPPDAAAVAMQVKLLTRRGQYDDARQRMESLPTGLRRYALGRVEPEVLFEAGEYDAAFAAAEELAERQTGKAEVQLWFATFAQKLEKYEAAAAAMRRAVELNPSEPNYWIQLIAVYHKLKDSRAIEQVVREANLALDAEYLPLLIAKYYEIRGQWQTAEDIYLSYFENRWDEIGANRQMAQFYLIPDRNVRPTKAPSTRTMPMSVGLGSKPLDCSPPQATTKIH